MTNEAFRKLSAVDQMRAATIWARTDAERFERMGWLRQIRLEISASESRWRIAQYEAANEQ